MDSQLGLVGTRCRWCDVEATSLVEVKPGDELKLPVKAEACDFHAGLLTREQPTSVDSLRRRHARDVPQLSIFDMPGLAPDSAILGG